MLVYGRKMKLLCLRQILEEYTDANHRLAGWQIVEKLSAMGINAERKGIYDDIEALNAFFSSEGSKAMRIEGNKEKKGYYLDNRPFSVPDLKLMIDAIQSSKFLSEAKTRELIEALEKLCNRYQREGLRRQVIVTNRVKNMNTNIHTNVDYINSAITANKQISFKYFNYNVKQEREFRKAGGYYTVSPYALVYSDDNYYLLAYDAQQEEIRSYRVDRMANFKFNNNDREGQEAFKKIDLAQFQKYTFGMYQGKKEVVTMIFRNSMMNAVIDRFGRQSYARAVDKDHFQITVTVSVSPQFFAWVFGLGNYARITEPQWVKDEMKKQLTGALKRYE